MLRNKGLSEKVLLLGIDGMDPRFSRKMVDEGKMPNLQKFLKKGETPIPCPIADASVRQHCVQRLRDLPLVDQRPGNADGAGHVHLVRVEQYLRLYGRGPVALSIAVGRNAFPHTGREALRETMFCQETISLLRSGLGMALSRQCPGRCTGPGRYAPCRGRCPPYRTACSFPADHMVQPATLSTSLPKSGLMKQRGLSLSDLWRSPIFLQTGESFADPGKQSG